MRKRDSSQTAAFMMAFFLTVSAGVSCSKSAETTFTELNDRQKEILSAMELSTDLSQLDLSQKHSIQRIEEMLSYLEKKYEVEFIYAGYIEKGINESEKLYAYPSNLGSKYTVTVKVGESGNFTDDFYDFSVPDLAEELIDNYLSEQFSKEDYRYFASTNACEIKMSEIVNENFQWKYGASNILFIKEDVCSMDEVEEFAVNYAKFLYEHQIDGYHRINIMAYFPDIDIEYSNSSDWYFDGKANMGFYCLFFDSSNKDIHMDCTVYDTDEKGEVIISNIVKNSPKGCKKTSYTYSVEEYFDKY